MIINNLHKHNDEWGNFCGSPNGSIIELNINVESNRNGIIFIKKDSNTSLTIQFCNAYNKLPLSTIAKTEQSKVYTIRVQDITKQPLETTLAQILCRVFELLRAKDPLV